MNKLLNFFVGIDISKTYFDAALVKVECSSQIIHQQFPQTQTGFLKMSLWLEENGVTGSEETLFCMEFTGLSKVVASFQLKPVMSPNGITNQAAGVYIKIS